MADAPELRCISSKCSDSSEEWEVIKNEDSSGSASSSLEIVERTSPLLAQEEEHKPSALKNSDSLSECNSPLVNQSPQETDAEELVLSGDPVKIPIRSEIDDSHVHDESQFSIAEPRSRESAQQTPEITPTEDYNSSKPIVTSRSTSTNLKKANRQRLSRTHVLLMLGVAGFLLVISTVLCRQGFQLVPPSIGAEPVGEGHFDNGCIEDVIMATGIPTCCCTIASEGCAKYPVESFCCEADAEVPDIILSGPPMKTVNEPSNWKDFRVNTGNFQIMEASSDEREASDIPMLSKHDAEYDSPFFSKGIFDLATLAGSTTLWPFGSLPAPKSNQHTYSVLDLSYALNGNDHVSLKESMDKLHHIEDDGELFPTLEESGFEFSFQPSLVFKEVQSANDNNLLDISAVRFYCTRDFIDLTQPEDPCVSALLSVATVATSQTVHASRTVDILNRAAEKVSDEVGNATLKFANATNGFFRTLSSMSGKVTKKVSDLTSQMDSRWNEVQDKALNLANNVKQETKHFFLDVSPQWVEKLSPKVLNNVKAGLEWVSRFKRQEDNDDDDDDCGGDPEPNSY
eukprot:Rmarinus@m.11691